MILTIILVWCLLDVLYQRMDVLHRNCRYSDMKGIVSTSIFLLMFYWYFFLVRFYKLISYVNLVSEVESSSNTSMIISWSYTRLADEIEITAIIGNISTTKDKKAKIIATVSDNFFCNHVRAVEQSVKKTEDTLFKKTLVDGENYVYKYIIYHSTYICSYRFR